MTGRRPWAAVFLAAVACLSVPAPRSPPPVAVFPLGVVDGAKRNLLGRPRTVGGLRGLYDLGSDTGAYESRVLQGIWAAAPYLHNGSVPTLAQLLTPAAQRVSSFPLGPNYDQTNIGIAATQPGSSYTFEATGCDDLDSGNSNCGHEYGTTLSPLNQKYLLEYLKTL